MVWLRVCPKGIGVAKPSASWNCAGSNSEIRRRYGRLSICQEREEMPRVMARRTHRLGLGRGLRHPHAQADYLPEPIQIEPRGIITHHLRSRILWPDIGRGDGAAPCGDDIRWWVRSRRSTRGALPFPKIVQSLAVPMNLVLRRRYWGNESDKDQQSTPKQHPQRAHQII